MQGPLNLSLDTQTAKTSVPKFLEGIHVKMRLTAINQDTVEGKGQVIKFAYELVDPAPQQDSQEPLLPGAFGSKVFDSVQLYDKNTKPGDPAPSWSINKICARQDGFLGTGDEGNKKGKPTRPKFDAECVSKMLGQVAFFKFKNKTGDYDGQDIASITHPSDVQGA